MAKKKSSSRKKNTVSSSPFAQAKNQLEQARRYAERNNYTQAWHAIQPALTTLEGLAEKGNERYLMLYVDALTTAGFIALFMDLPNKSVKLFDKSMAVMLQQCQSRPVEYAKGLVDSTNHIAGVLQTSVYANLQEKALQYLQSTVDLLDDCLSQAPNELAVTYYESVRELADQLFMANRAKEGFVYLDKIHTLFTLDGLIQNADTLTIYPLHCLQHANWLLAEGAFDEAIEMAQKSIDEFEKLGESSNQMTETEALMAQSIKLEGLFALERYDDVLELVVKVAPVAERLHGLATTAQASVYLQVLQVWGDTLQAKEDLVGAKVKFEQAMAILGEQYDADSLDHEQYYLPITARLGNCELLEENYEAAAQRFEALVVRTLQTSPGRYKCDPVIEQPLIIALLCSFQWKKAQEYMTLHFEYSYNYAVVDIEFIKTLIELVEELKDNLVDEPEEMAGCEEVASFLAKWQARISD